MGEYETFLMESECNIPVSVIVLHNVYGEPCDYSSDKSQVIPSLIRKAIFAPEIPFVVFGVFRYLFLVYGREKGGSPTDVLLGDLPLQLGIVGWITTVFVLLYR